MSVKEYVEKGFKLMSDLHWQSKESALTPETFMASVGDVLSNLELRVLQMKVQEHIRNLQRTGVTGEWDVGMIV